jgi:hypothetical protein
VTDGELKTWWPDLWAVATELRRINQSAVADLLVDAVRAGSTSGEIIDGVASVLRSRQELRRELSDAGMTAWDAVLADVYRAYPGARFSHWFARWMSFSNLFAALAGRRNKRRDH